MSATDQLQTKSHHVVQAIRANSPNQRQVVGLVTLLTAAVILFVVGGLALAGTAVTLLFLTPVLIFFSPILIPLAIVAGLGTAGVVATGALGLATYSTISWVYSYYKGRGPYGADQVDNARGRIADTATHLKGLASDYTTGVKDYLHSSKQQTLDAVPTS